MGIVRMGPPKDIILKIKELTDVNLFVETGTFQGWTSFWAASNFKKVKTIEFSKDIYQATSKKFNNLDNVDFIFGDSRQELQKIISELHEPAIFWLDAHWCNLGSYGEDDQCPLIDELSILNQSDIDHCILIDDARLFLAPPPHPNSTSFYPDIEQLILKLSERNNTYITILDDVIISVPIKIKERFLPYLQQKTTEIKKRMDKENIVLDRFKRLKRIFKIIIGYRFWRK